MTRACQDQDPTCVVPAGHFFSTLLDWVWLPDPDQAAESAVTLVGLHAAATAQDMSAAVGGLEFSSGTGST